MEQIQGHGIRTAVTTTMLEGTMEEGMKEGVNRPPCMQVDSVVFGRIVEL